MGYGVFVQKNPGIITLFCATKSFEAEVFFAVDEGVLRREAAHEFAVDDSVGSVVVEVGFFDTDVERVVVDGTTEGESHQTPFDQQDAAEGL